MLMVNKFGNAYVNANDPQKVEHYKEKGYSEVKVNKPAPRKAKAPKDKE